nr:MAG TPA: hypothetical protein [Caudoviricetes sp.]
MWLPNRFHKSPFLPIIQAKSRVFCPSNKKRTAV